ncbi:MAG: hypothetical protein K8R77_08820 [Anaerolineaceae bacterium]|nr:hypothetical protein [Anaerolineaceae bacterium]
MQNDSEYQNRCSIRLPEYDYTSPGAYFVTLLAYQRKNTFANIKNTQIILSKLGNILHKEWLYSAQIRSELQIHEDEFVIMPNHMHGIVWVKSTGILKSNPLPTITKFSQVSKSLGSFIAGFKGGVTRIARQELGIDKVWQRNYYEHVIRDDADWERIASYIQDNPRKWEEDRFFR